MKIIFQRLIALLMLAHATFIIPSAKPVVRGRPKTAAVRPTPTASAAPKSIATKIPAKPVAPQPKVNRPVRPATASQAARVLCKVADIKKSEEEEISGALGENIKNLKEIKLAAQKAVQNPQVAAKFLVGDQFAGKFNSEFIWVKEIPVPYGQANKAQVLQRIINDFDTAILKGQLSQEAFEDRKKAKNIIQEYTIAQAHKNLNQYIDEILKDLSIYNSEKLAKMKDDEARKAGILTRDEVNAQQAALKKFELARKQQELNKQVAQKPVNFEDEIERAIMRGDLPKVKTIVPASLAPTHLFRRYKFTKTPLDLARDSDQYEITKYLDEVAKKLAARPSLSRPRAKSLAPVRKPSAAAALKTAQEQQL